MAPETEMTASQSGLFSLQEFTDVGAPLVGGRIYTYVFGTTTHKTAYTDKAGTIAHQYTSDGAGGSYIALNARGELPAPLYLTTGSYDIALKRADGSTVWTRRADPSQDSSDQLAADLASTASATKGAGMVGFSPQLNYATQTLGASLSHREIIVTDYPWLAKFDGTTDDAAAINAAIVWLGSVGGGIARMPRGTTVVNATPILAATSGVSLLGMGSGATIIKNNGTGDTVICGNGSTDTTGSTVGGFTVQGSVTSGRGVWGRMFTDSSSLVDIYTNSGSKGISLDSCYSLRVIGCRSRAAAGNGQEANALCHNIVWYACKSQVNGAHGFYTAGCYGVQVLGGNYEFNAHDGINVASGRGIQLINNYIEGIMPAASGYAGIQIVAADTVTISGGLLDATQAGIAGTDGTGTYVKVSGASSRVRVREYGFVSIAANQTHVEFGAAASNCEAIVPLGATYTNASASCRVYNDAADEVGFAGYCAAVQSYPSATWAAMTIDAELYDTKSEFASNSFVPKDHGVYDFDAYIGIAALAAGQFFAVRLYNVTDGVELAKRQFANTGAAAVTTIENVHFKEKLIPAKSYQIQVFNADSAARNSTNGASTARLTIKRI